MAPRIWLNEKVGFHPTFSRHGIAQSLSALALRIWLNEKVRFAASVFGGVGDGKKEMLRKKYHVVRKKNHVVRKLFYVASIFGRAARRRNRSPWELSSTPWELSSTAGDFSSTASRRRQRLQCVYRAPVFSGGAHTSLLDTNMSFFFTSVIPYSQPLQVRFVHFTQSTLSGRLLFVKPKSSDRAEERVEWLQTMRHKKEAVP